MTLTTASDLAPPASASPPPLSRGRGVLRGGALGALVLGLLAWASRASAQDAPGPIGEARPDVPAAAPPASAAAPGAPAPDQPPEPELRPAAVSTPVAEPRRAPEPGPPPPPARSQALEAPVAYRAPAYSPFLDTRLTWTFGDDDFLHQTGEAVPLSPDASIADRPQYRLFFDSLNSRFSGRENLTHLALYRKMGGFSPSMVTEAALVLRLNLSQLASQAASVNSVMEDAGTYLRLFWHTGDRNAEKPTGLGVVLYPIDTDRFRLGWLYDISWGGTNARINQSIFPRLQGSAPGAKLQYDGAGWSAFAGFKTASIVEVEERIVQGGAGEGAATDTVRLAQTNFGFLGGAGVDVAEALRVDVGTGYFQQGRFEEPDVLGERVYTFGFSGRVVAHVGMPTPGSVDFLLYRNDPDATVTVHQPTAPAPTGTAWAVSGEVTRLMQNVKDFDAAGATTLQPGNAAAVQFLVQAGALRGTVSAIYRDLAFVLRNQPSFIPFQSIPEDAVTEDEVFAAAGVDYHVAAAHLTPGLGLGVQLPSTFRSDSVDLAGEDTSRTIVVREQGNLTVLPAGEGRVPIFQARASLKWELSPIMSAVTWLQLVQDNNATRLVLDPSGTYLLRQFVDPLFLGYGLSVQARF